MLRCGCEVQAYVCFTSHTHTHTYAHLSLSLSLSVSLMALLSCFDCLRICTIFLPCLVLSLFPLFVDCFDFGLVLSFRF